MKNLLPLSLVVVAFSAGCTTSAPLVLDPVGPQVFQESSEATGTLVVFSGLEIGPNQSDPSNETSHHTSYQIWSKDGATLLQTVRNYSVPVAEDAPTPVELSPGQYLVKALANHYAVNVPVIIVAHRTTDVHLDGSFRRDQDRSSPNKVYLPDGEVVGSRAQAAPPAVAALAR